MQEQRKQKIADSLKTFCDNAGGQNAAANKLKNVSAATITQVLKRNWVSISDKMWRSIAKQIGVDNQWQFVDNRVTKQLFALYRDAQQYGNVHAVVMQEGKGKTANAEQYCLRNENAYLIKCNEYFNKKTFLSIILSVMGKDGSGTVDVNMNNLIKYLQESEEPLLIFDEFDKLSNQVMLLFITLYNILEGKCGIVIQATDHLKKRIERGVTSNTQGYREIFSRMGKRFIEINSWGKYMYEDISGICIANGVTEKKEIEAIIDDASGDFRRVKKLIHALKLKGE